MEERKKNILIAIPSYTSAINVGTMISIFNNMKHVESFGHQITFAGQLNGVYISTSRNILADIAIKNDHTDIIFVDWDISFEYDAIYKLISRNVDVVAGIYPYKEYYKSGYPVEIKLDKDNYPVINAEEKLIETEYVPAGFLRITVNTLKKIAENFPLYKDGNGLYRYFENGMGFLHEGDNTDYGEDLFFCKLCQKAGIKVYADPTIEFIHYGTLPKKGKYSEFLKKGGRD